MTTINQFFIKFSLSLLFGALIIGVIASIAFLYPQSFNSWFPFHKLRPMHTSFALFWIISGAAGCICYFKNQLQPNDGIFQRASSIFMVTWMLTILAVFIHYSLNHYGGREYWEFPPYLNIPLLAAWLFLTFSIIRGFNRNSAAYEWMWFTGIIFFLITFTEQNLWHLAWFRESYIREVTVQWKANGSMVGAWNQMINGLSIFLLVRISGDTRLANSRKTYFLFFLGLFNLMFNWGHHVYNLPNANWMRAVAYGVSMTEWVILIMIIRSFRKTLTEGKKLRNYLPYRFIAAAELWVFANLFLALLMSIPAINRYTHGTHITVAHAMGTTIGINSMILLAVIGYILKIDTLSEKLKKIIATSIRATNISLGIFWLSLIVGGLIKGYLQVNQPDLHFTLLMEKVMPFILSFTAAGIFVLFSLGTITFLFLKKPFPAAEQN
ncbi:cbb3-type cytochrome c oxidase subunit I [Pedobacter sp. AW31-3R]|uniref:cbb3-type cytochrome c oxidase subunit I n=1 Tax=Pedobacter sp. AW31-3R TaxID=3445781 RepID=UPI003F9F1011